jgi:hypothetical protein
VSAAATELAELLEPLRDQAVGSLLEAMARALETGAAVVPEPELRDDAGRVLRQGPLNLPQRGDLEITRDGDSRLRRVEGGPAPEGESLVARTAEGFEAEIHAFRWDAAEFTLLSRGVSPDWAPLRLWFLEWFQSRYSEVSPDLYGALHSLQGPEDVPGGYAFILDFGSAPAACVTDLIAAAAATGAESMRLGHL